MTTPSEERTVERRLSKDGTRWVIVERWLDRQLVPPRWRSKNRTVRLSRGERLYFEERRNKETPTA
jgi:hypothetical protein